MLSIKWYIEEGNKYIIKGRELDWKKFCNENIDHVYVVGEVLFVLQSLSDDECDYQAISEQLRQNKKDMIVNDYIENMIVKFSFRGYDFVNKTCLINQERK